MKFLVDAQLPQRLVHWLQASGHDAIHTRTLPDGNRTADEMINQVGGRACIRGTIRNETPKGFMFRPLCRPKDPDTARRYGCAKIPWQYSAGRCPLEIFAGLAIDTVS